MWVLSILATLSSLICVFASCRGLCREKSDSDEAAMMIGHLHL